MTGRVSLIGAGPGDPELLTLKAVRRLAEADRVLHDALVSAETKALGPRARWLDVGKRAGRASVSQDLIHHILIRSALRGERVVRLKGGDPFVLGRGAEEALALVAAGIPFEIVPGVSAAVAAPALAGIPVTHRGVASGFLVVSGHDASAYRPVLDSLAPNAVTLVVLMGIAHRAAIAELLVRRGWSPETPAATLLSASTPRAASLSGVLGDWRSEAPLETSEPGTLVIGEVVGVGATIRSLGNPCLASTKGESNEPGGWPFLEERVGVPDPGRARPGDRRLRDRARAAPPGRTR